MTAVGNLGADPELRTVEVNGSKEGAQEVDVASFTMYCNGKRGGQETLVKIRVTAWRGLAGTCEKYLSKGREVMVIGEPQANEFGSPRIWETREGEPRADYEITADKVVLLRDGNGHSSSPEASPQRSELEKETFDESEDDEDWDDLDW
jgi:single-stranded DNA-binding protein